MPDLEARRRVLTRSVPICLLAFVLLLPIATGHVFESYERRLPYLQRGRTAPKLAREHRAPAPVRAEPMSRSRVDLSAYKGLGSWIDIYNHWPWDHPGATVRILHRKGVKTIFLQTSNYGAKNSIYRPRQTGKFLRVAHRKKMKVVAWYVPSFAHPKVDRERSKAAIRFTAKGGHRFDSFGMDIEATVVGNIYRRNRRMLGLSKAVRRFAGKDYPLGAITPDPVTGLYWPRFPYERVRRLYDVFVPMGYFSFRASGYRKVKRYTHQGIRVIRRETGDKKVPIHVIGGIGGETKAAEAKGFVRAVRGDAIGASYYDFAITTPEEWSELRVLAGHPPPERDEDEPKAPAPKKKKKAQKGDDKKRRSERGKNDRRDEKKDRKGRDDRKKRKKDRNARNDVEDDIDDGTTTSPRPLPS